MQNGQEKEERERKEMGGGGGGDRLPNKYLLPLFTRRGGKLSEEAKISNLFVLLDSGGEGIESKFAPFFPPQTLEGQIARRKGGGNNKCHCYTTRPPYKVPYGKSNK